MASVTSPVYDQLLPSSVDLYRVFVGSSVDADPSQLLPQLLNQLEALGETAKELKQALGSNGHRAEKLEELARLLTQREEP